MATQQRLPNEFAGINDVHERTAAIQAAGYRGWDGMVPPGFLYEGGLFLRPSEWLLRAAGWPIH